MEFENFEISEELKKAIKDMGFKKASFIQQETIPLILQGKDVIGQSQTGTGKTAAFGIPIVEMIKETDKEVQSIVLSPTRELAIQIAEELRKLSKYKKGVNILAVYGGQPIEKQLRELKNDPQIVIGTPGRLKDHVIRGTISLDSIKTVVLDEADEMLDMGFRDEIEFILRRIPKIRQTILFSATMPRSMFNITKRYQKDPVYVKAVKKELTVKKIDQYYVETREEQKCEVLARLLDMYNPRLSLVFVNTKRKVEEVVLSLRLRGYLVDGLQGDMSQVQRDVVMQRFRDSKMDVLVATDVAARGIDVSNVDVVFNYDIPQDLEYYVHRIGRTGRAGRAGRSFTFATYKDSRKIKEIESYSNAKIIQHKIPAMFDIEDMKSNKLLNNIKEVIKDGNDNKYESVVDQLIQQDYKAIDIAKALINMYGGGTNTSNLFDDLDLSNTGARDGMVRLFINIGKEKGIGPKDIISTASREVGIDNKAIGSIRVYDNFSFVEVPEEYAQEFVFIMRNREIRGNKINVEPAKRK